MLSSPESSDGDMFEGGLGAKWIGQLILGKLILSLGCSTLLEVKLSDAIISSFSLANGFSVLTPVSTVATLEFTTCKVIECRGS